jgi:predicted DNA-binding transcriptional regulator YafY
MFERDKDELRAFGVPIETIPSPDRRGPGYRPRRATSICPTWRSAPRGGQARKRDPYGYRSLPSLIFEPDELAAVADAAARVRQLGDLLSPSRPSRRCSRPATWQWMRPATSGSSPPAPAAPEVLVTLDRALQQRKG